MSLVAYENSDDSDSENEDVDAELNNLPLSDKNVLTSPSDTKSIFASLPAPKSFNKSDLEPEDDLETNKQSSSTKPTGRNAHQPVKIYLEPLSEFADVEKPSKKQRNLSNSGSGLFSVLPPPKNAAGKMGNRVLLPYSLTRGVIKPEKKAVIKRPTATSLQEEDEDNGLPEDFFGLQSNKSQDLRPLPVAETSSPKIEFKNKVVTVPILNPVVNEEELADLPSTAADEMDLSAVGVSKAQKIEDLFQDQAFMRLRGKKRNIEEEPEIIDVSQDEQMPSWQERSKLLTQEDENAPVNAGPQPSAQHRRKHQITYLAYQAKARELELKNQWAQNQFTKQQTRAKYGF